MSAACERGGCPPWARIKERFFKRRFVEGTRGTIYLPELLLKDGEEERASLLNAQSGLVVGALKKEISNMHCCLIGGAAVSLDLIEKARDLSPEDRWKFISCRIQSVKGGVSSGSCIDFVDLCVLEQVASDLKSASFNNYDEVLVNTASLLEATENNLLYSWAGKCLQTHMVARAIVSANSQIYKADRLFVFGDSASANPDFDALNLLNDARKDLLFNGMPEFAVAVYNDARLTLNDQIVGLTESVEGALGIGILSAQTTVS